MLDGPYELLAWAFFFLVVLAFAVLWMLERIGDLEDRLTRRERRQKREEFYREWEEPHYYFDGTFKENGLPQRKGRHD